MKTALVHDWLISPVGGSENALREIFSLFPAPIFTLLYNACAFENTPFASAEINTSFIQRLPGALNHFRSYLPLFPTAIERFDLSSYDLIISSSHCVAKGIIKTPNQLHICYCHTPMRYAWDLSQDYFAEAKLDRGLKGILAKVCLRYLRKWDVTSSNRVDHFIANSKYVADRIERSYGRKATVIYPPVDTAYFSLQPNKENYYLTSSRLVPYKKIDLIVDAFAKMPDLKLVVIGDGPQKLAKASNIEFLGYQPNHILRNHLQKSKAFVFAAIEDFGIAPIEAMACGTPVIALGKGGTAETVLDQITGIHFQEQTTEDLIKAVRKFEASKFDPEVIAKHAQRFSTQRFRSEFQKFVSTF